MPVAPRHPTGRMLSAKVGWIDSNTCNATVSESFDVLLHSVKVVGSDGGANESSTPHSRRVAAGAAVADIERNEVAFLFSSVPGPQTVPRAELWALYQILSRMFCNTLYTIYIDAQYVVNGMSTKSSF